MKLTPVQINRVNKLRTSIILDAALGNYKNYKNAKKEYASLAVKDYQTIKNLPAPKFSVPLFSKTGFNLLFVRFLELFRIKTPDEKLFKKMAKEDAIKQKLTYNKSFVDYKKL